MKADLSYDLAPPLGRTLGFFAGGPLSMLLAGGLLWTGGSSCFTSPWLPETIALVHVGTLGFLASIMLGAVLQLGPVLGGVAVSGAKHALWGFGMFWLGLMCLVVGLVLPSHASMYVAMGLLLSVLFVFAFHAIISLRRSSSQSATLGAMRLALWSLLAVVLMGAWMAHGHAGGQFPGPRRWWIQVHLSLGLFGWVGALLVGVSWELLPMFYLAPSVPLRVQGRVLRTLQVGLLGLFSCWFLSLFLPSASRALEGLTVGLGGVLGVLIWLWHPWQTLRLLRGRRRKRVDPSKDYWVAAMWMGPVTFLIGIATLLSGDPRWNLTFGWVAIWGWAGLVVHGMLTRIVPFLVWLHRFSSVAAFPGVPTMADLFPARSARRGLLLHGLALALAVAACWIPGTLLPALVGGLISLTGLHLARAMTVASSWPSPVSGR